jgi:bifunctional non-homologous end joining protein LigD
MLDKPVSKRIATRLKPYRKKRDFTKTHEPVPQIGKKSGAQFVVQKHDARRLHFDLRLELNGVLKSWAVTKGPSLIPGVKRLAVQTEDHPMGYLEWEGVIPKGEYGGGTMIVWDRGSWAPVGDAEKGLKKGHLQFVLSGKRLKGLWDLVRMSRRDSWLLIKRTDEFAIASEEEEPVVTQHTSVLSKRSNQDLAKQKAIRPDHAARQKVQEGRKLSLPDVSRLGGAKKGILPVFVEPSLAMLADRPPKGTNWLHEIKYDGYRMQARLDGGKVKLLTRKGLDWTKRFASIARALQTLPLSSGLLDGEIIVQDESGVSSFSGLQSDLKSGRHDRMAFMVFDMMYCEGTNLTRTSLLERKEALEAILASLPANSPIRFSEHLDVSGSELLQHACRLGLEGIISKQTNSKYISTRGGHWIKSKCNLRQEFVVVGYMPSTASRTAIGSLVLGYYENEKLVHAGRAGTGYSNQMAHELWKTLQPIETSQPKFKTAVTVQNSRGVKWVKPELVAEVEYRGWTSDNLLRQAAFKGLREDKFAKEIRKEHIARTSNQKEVSISDFRLTHPERVLWEDKGITKQGLAEFYAGIADWILPHVTDRVLSLVRCPSGTSDKCFYAKHAWDGADKSLKLVDVGEGKPMIAISDLRGLIALVQSSVLEIHPWGSQIKNLELPDRLTLDLDPGEAVEWANVVAAAQEVRDRLSTYKLESYVKTTGGKGLHVVVPLRPKATWDMAKGFCQSLAEAMARDTPDKYVSVMTKSRRRGRIFVDYLRNGRGATAVAAYSTRARTGAPVSVPITWEELSSGIRANQFTVENLRQRLDFLKQDPWEGFFDLKQTLGSNKLKPFSSRRVVRLDNGGSNVRH